MDLDYCREFILVARCLSFSDAAKLSITSKSTITRHVQQLEDELGYALFERDKHNVKLTQEGLIFLNKVDPLLRSFDKLKNIRDITTEKNKLTIGIHYADSNGKIFESLQKFMAKFPEIDIEIKNTPHHNFLNMLLQKKIDIALELHVKSHEDPEISCVNLNNYGFVMAYPTSRDLRKHRLNIKTLEKEPVFFPSFREHPGIIDLIENIEKNNNIKIAETHEVMGLDVLFAEVLMGRGITVIPETFETFLPKGLSTMKVKGLPEEPLTALFWKDNPNELVRNCISHLAEMSKE